MFKQRLIEALITVIGAPLILILWGGLCYLVVEYTPIEQWMDWFMENMFIWLLGIFILILVLIAIWKFLFWLFIEPYKEWNKNKKSK